MSISELGGFLCQFKKCGDMAPPFKSRRRAKQFALLPGTRSAALRKCPGRDLNPHARRATALNRVCIPIPPPGHVRLLYNTRNKNILQQQNVLPPIPFSFLLRREILFSFPPPSLPHLPSHRTLRKRTPLPFSAPPTKLPYSLRTKIPPSPAREHRW